jgi:L-ribulose-5-phosphate 4-epimerase
VEILEAKKKVLYWSQKGYSQDLFAGTSGNLSIFLPAQKLMVITPSSVRYDSMLLEDIVVTDYEGEKVEGYRKPSSEVKLHLAIYKRGLANSVVHTHSPFATAFAVNQKNIPLILVEMIPFLGGEVPCAGFAFAGTEELAKIAADGVKEKNACLLANHGVVAIGDTIEQAFIRAEYVEDAAKICKIAMSGGSEIKIVTAKRKLKS